MLFKKKKITEDNVKTIEWRTYKDKSYEELEKEVDSAYSLYVRFSFIKNLIIWLVILYLSKDILFFFANFALPRRASEILAYPQDTIKIEKPISDDLDEDEPSVYEYNTLESAEEVKLHKLSKFTITGMEVAKSYLFVSSYFPWNKEQKIMERIALVDIGVVWDKLADIEILKDYIFICAKDAKNREIYPRLRPGAKQPPIAWTKMGDSMSHIQAIPANSNVMHALIYSKKNQPIKMEGYIVNVSVGDKVVGVNTPSGTYNGYDVRNGGDKKIMLVEKVQIGKRVYE